MISKLKILPAFAATSHFGDARTSIGGLNNTPNDLRVASVVAVIALLTALGWCALAGAAPMALVFVCHGGGVASLTPAWDFGRAAALIAMWGVMSCVMMLPCAMSQIVDKARASGPREGMYKIALLFSLGYLCVVVATGVGGAMAEWILESTGVMQAGSIIGDGYVRGVLLVVGGLILGVALWRSSTKVVTPHAPHPGADLFTQGFRHGWSRLGSCLAMICLQLAGGPMNISWMAALAVWMFAGSVRGRGALLSGLGGVALLGVSGFLLFGNLG